MFINETKMSDEECGEAVQVLSVEEDGKYRVDEAALQRVVQNATAHGLPVAVVSVAGATRGGKSFLLDFFLRYLRAPEEAQRSGAWLGADDEPLTGFSWRGGCERDTQGILLWSEPIVVTRGSGDNSEQVAVVLMDTQGTFDSSSTVRDSSTIFAMSTLLSSVQIYNLSQNIKEDDLQYLQFFTEYGTLLRDGEAGSPFQVLQFLVRDWSYAYEHPVGSEGGQQLLDKRLEIRSEQASELREIRQHVRSVFESVRCCLLPHPGLTVACNPQFKGCPADISYEFKNALLELVPTLFNPENLVLKTVNGQTITVEDLAEYFKTYIEIFNSDSLPMPKTVMQATSSASLEIALSASRSAYVSHMERGTAGHVPRAALPRLHGAALHAARAAFAARRTLAAPARAAERRDALLQELEAMLPNYVAINNGRILETVAACKASYEAAMREPETCLTPDELEARHDAAAAAARATFESSRSDVSEDDEEEVEDRKLLEKELEDLLPMYREKNKEWIARAAAAAGEVYAARMRDGCAKAPCLQPLSLDALHRKAKPAALTTFLQAWHDASTVPTKHTTTLLNSIEERFREFESENETKNQRAVDDAIDLYSSLMFEVWNDWRGRCLHPRDLDASHLRHRAVAVAAFRDKRDRAGRNRPADHHASDLETKLELLYFEFAQRNNADNKKAVKKAHNFYVNKMAILRQGQQGMLEDFSEISRHESVKQEALVSFRQSRQPGGVYDVDSYLEDLKKEIEKTHEQLVARVIGGVGVVGLGVALVSTLLFRR